MILGLSVGCGARARACVHAGASHLGLRWRAGGGGTPLGRLQPPRAGARDERGHADAGDCVQPDGGERGARHGACLCVCV